jgi:hypothetical protein
MPAEEAPMSRLELPEPSRLGEVPWLEPYPDALIAVRRRQGRYSENRRNNQGTARVVACQGAWW